MVNGYTNLTSGTKNIYPCPYIDVNDRGHRLRITHTHRRCYGRWKANLDTNYPNKKGQTPTQAPLAFYYRIDLIS